MQTLLNLWRIFSPLFLIVAVVLMLALMLTVKADLMTMFLVLLIALGLFGYSWKAHHWFHRYAKGARFLKTQNFSEALAEFQQGLQGQYFHSDDVRKVLLQDGLAQAQRGLGDYFDAEQTARGAALMAQRVWKKPVAQVRMVWNTWGLCLLDLARLTEAEEVFRTGLGWVESQNKTQELATWLNNLAVALTYQKKYPKALELYERSLVLHEKKYGLRHFLTGLSLMNLAFIHIRLNQPERAEAFALQAQKVFDLRLPTRDVHQAMIRNNLGLVRLQQNRLEEAEALFRQALGISQQIFGPEHPFHAKPLHGLVLALKARQQWDEAELLGQRELRLRQEYLVPTHPDLAETIESYMDLLRNTGRADQAIDIYQQFSQNQTRFVNYLATGIQAHTPGQKVPLEMAIQKREPDGAQQ